MGEQALPAEPRNISGPLMLGLLALPLIFGWFLLRSGYARSTRLVVLAYAVTYPLLYFVVSLLSGR